MIFIFTGTHIIIRTFICIGHPKPPSLFANFPDYYRLPRVSLFSRYPLYPPLPPQWTPDPSVSRSTPVSYHKISQKEKKINVGTHRSFYIRTMFMKRNLRQHITNFKAHIFLKGRYCSHMRYNPLLFHCSWGITTCVIPHLWYSHPFF